jgi:hypothetical protein
MTSSFTTRNRLNKQGTGDNTNSWGEVLNSGALDLIDAALDGFTSVAVNAGVTLTTTSGGADQARARALKFTGAGGFTVTLPALEKWYWIWNAAAAAVTVSVGGPNTAILAPNDRLLVLTDGIGVYGLALGGVNLKTYIDTAILATTGSLPATTGNEGKALIVRSGAWTPDNLVAADITGLAAWQASTLAALQAQAIAFAVVL